MIIHYRIEPPNLPHICDGCGAIFSISHTLNSKKDSLIINHTNELHDGVSNLARNTFTSSHVRNAPLTHICRAIQSVKFHPTGHMIGSAPILKKPPKYTYES